MAIISLPVNNSCREIGDFYTQPYELVAIYTGEFYKLAVQLVQNLVFTFRPHLSAIG
ncbi:hypothetical protein GCM10028806_09400 [Spirosoma terrae]